MAPDLDELVVADRPEAWEAAGFCVDPDGTCRVGHVRVRLVGSGAGKRIVGWSLRGLPAGTDDIDGLPTAVSTDAPCAPAEHPNGVVGLDHLVVLTPDSSRTVAVLEALGMPLRRTREVPAEQYGFEAMQSFFRVGEPILELLGPREPTGDGPAGFFGVAWTVADLDGLAERLGSALGRPKAAVQPGRRIATLRHKEVGMTVATAFMTPDP